MGDFDGWTVADDENDFQGWKPAEGEVLFQQPGNPFGPIGRANGPIAGNPSLSPEASRAALDAVATGLEWGSMFTPYGRLAGAVPKLASWISKAEKVPLLGRAVNPAIEAFGGAGTNLGIDYFLGGDADLNSAAMEGGVGTAAGTLLPIAGKVAAYPFQKVSDWVTKTFDPDKALLRAYNTNWREFSDVAANTPLDETITRLKGQGIIDDPALAVNKDTIFENVRDKIVAEQTKTGQSIGNLRDVIDQQPGSSVMFDQVNPKSIINPDQIAGPARSVALREEERLARQLMGDDAYDEYAFAKGQFEKLNDRKKLYNEAGQVVTGRTTVPGWEYSHQQMMDHWGNKIGAFESDLASKDVRFKQLWETRKNFDDQGFQVAGQSEAPSYVDLGNRYRGELQGRADAAGMGDAWGAANQRYSDLKEMYNPKAASVGQGGPVEQLAAQGKVPDTGEGVAYLGANSQRPLRSSFRVGNVLPGKTPEDNYLIGTNTHPWQKSGFSKLLGGASQIGGEVADFAGSTPLWSRAPTGWGELAMEKDGLPNHLPNMSSASGVPAPAMASDGRPEGVKTPLMQSFQPDERAGNVPRHVGAVDPRMVGSFLNQYVGPQDIQPLAMQAMKVFATKDQKEIARFLGALSEKYPDMPFEKGPVTGLPSEWQMDDGTTKLFSDLDVQKWANEIENSPIREDEKAQRLRALYTDGTVYPLDRKLNNFGPPLMSDDSMEARVPAESVALKNMMSTYSFARRQQTPLGSAKVEY